MGIFSKKQAIRERSAFTGFPYDAALLSAYLATKYGFVICLKDGEIIRFEPEDRNGFQDWLCINKIRNITV